MKKAILFITFNRLDTAKKVFEQIKIAKPPRLYLASDGARKNKENEFEIVENVRKWILDNIDWQCKVETLFRDENLGCGKNVSDAITWFFKHEEDGIILEDDCVPSQSFFNFCEELLDKYKDDKRIFHISGDAPIENLAKKESYYFTNFQTCWGWASWADRWQYYKFDLDNYDRKNIKKFSKRKEVQRYWQHILDKMINHQIDTWDYQWTFCIIAHDGYCINPYKNLINNIGKNGAHFYNKSSRLNRKTYTLDKIIHPDKVEIDEKITNDIYTNTLKIKGNFFYKKEKFDNVRLITLLNFIKIKYINKKIRPNFKIGQRSILSKKAKFRYDLNSFNPIEIGDDCIIACNFIFESNQGKIEIGNRTYINAGVDLISRNKITIGDDVTIGWNCTIYDHNSHSIDWKERQKDIKQELENCIKNKNMIENKNWASVKSRPITICNKAWIGFGCTILNGVTIGEGAIVGAKSVVRDNVEPWTIVAGNPAVVIKRIKHE